MCVCDSTENKLQTSIYKYNNNRNNDIGTWNRNEPTICGVTRSDSKTTDRNTVLAKTNETTDSVEIN